MAKMSKERAWIRGVGASGLAVVTGWSFVNCSGGSDRPVDTYVMGTEAGGIPRDSGSHDATMPPPEEAAAASDVASSADAADASDAVDAADTSDGPSCEAGLSFCGGGCTDTRRDPSNCGQCTNACGMGLTCIASKCNCDTTQGQVLCNNTCVSTLTDVNNCGACGHSCQGSTCSGGLCQPTVVAQPNAPLWDIAVDSTYVYWTQIGSSTSVGAVSKKPFAGTATVWSVGGDPVLDDPHGIAVDVQNVYWVDYASGAVESTPLLGGPGTIYSSSTADGAAPTHPIDIVVDGTNVYWVTFDGGEVIRESITGGAMTAIATGENHPHALAIDATNVYWVDLGGTTAGTGSVRQAPKTGTAVTPVILSSSEDQAWDIAIDASSVYWTDRANPGTVKKVPIGGGPVVTLAQNQGAPYGIAVDADYVYWTNFDDNTVMRLPKILPDGGQAPFALATSQNNPSAIAVDATPASPQAKNVYWANGAGNILKVAK